MEKSESNKGCTKILWCYFVKGEIAKMRKFMLINSPIFWDSVKEKEQYLSPLGLGYIATYLEKINNIYVEIVDCVKENLYPI